MLYRFECFGVNPLPKERPRIRGNGGGGYTPARTLDYEKRIGWIIKGQVSPDVIEEINQTPLGIVLHFIRKTHAHADTDNLTKAVKDGLQNILWENDWLIKGELAYISHDPKDFGFILSVMDYPTFLEKTNAVLFGGEVKTLPGLPNKKGKVAREPRKPRKSSTSSTGSTGSSGRTRQPSLEDFIRNGS